MKIVHIILTTAVDAVPLVTVGNAVVEIIEIACGRIDMHSVSILTAHKVIPVVVGMQSRPGVPRIVDHLCTAMGIGRHHKIIFFGHLHKSNCFGLPGVAVGMRAVFGVGIVAVEIHIVGVVTRRSVNSMVATGISAVGIGSGIDPNLRIIYQRSYLRISSVVGKQIIYHAQQNDVSGSFVAVHGAGVKKLRLGLARGHVIRNFSHHQLTPLGGLPDAEHLTQVGVFGGKLVHHRDVSFVGRIEIPIVDAFDVDIVEHAWIFYQLAGFGQHFKRQLIFKKVSKFFLICVSENKIVLHRIDGNLTGKALQVGIGFFESEIDFAAIAKNLIYIYLLRPPRTQRYEKQEK